MARPLHNMLGAYLGLYLVLVGAFAGAADPPSRKVALSPEQLRTFADKHAKEVAYWTKFVKQYGEELEALKKAKIPRITSGPNRKQRLENEKVFLATQRKDTEERLRNAKHELRDYQAGKLPNADVLFYKGSATLPAQKKIGTLDNVPVVIEQVIDADSLLASVQGVTVLLRISTTDLVDDAVLKLDSSRQFMVDGTHRFTTVSGGSKTVLDIREVEMDAVRAFVMKGAKP